MRISGIMSCQCFRCFCHIFIFSHFCNERFFDNSFLWGVKSFITVLQTQQNDNNHIPMTSFLKSLSSNSLTKLKSDSLKLSWVHPQQLNHFPKALATNDDTLFVYIRHLVSGPTTQQKNYNQYIFNHLKNTIDHQFNTLTLRNTCKFIMTLILLGNLHVYENIVKYLLAGMVNKVNELFQRRNNPKREEIKPVWHLSEFCLQTLFVLAEWLPTDFYNPQKPSIFAKIKQKYHLNLTDFKYFNMDKIVFCYRIIKDLGINNADTRCYKCDAKSGNKSPNKKPKCYTFKQKFHERSSLESKHNIFNKQNTKQKKDMIWETGFQVNEITEVNESEIPPSDFVSQETDNIKVKSKRLWSPDDYAMFNKKQIQENQLRLKDKLKKLNKNVKEVSEDLYDIQQKKLIQQYKVKRQKQLQAKKLQLKKKELQNDQDFGASSFNKFDRSTSRKQRYIESIQDLSKMSSPRKYRHKEQKQVKFGHIQNFINFLNSKSVSFENNFKKALICSKGNILLKRIGNTVLKFRSISKSNMLKVKLFANQIQQEITSNQNLQKPSQSKSQVQNRSQTNSNYSKSVIQQSKLYINSQIKDIKAPTTKITIEFMEPKNNLQLHETTEQRTELILKYALRSLQRELQFQPIIIKVNDDVMYLPVGYWHMVKQSSRQMSFVYEQSQVKNPQEEEKDSKQIQHLKQHVILNKDISKSLTQMIPLFQKQFNLTSEKLAQLKQNNDKFKGIGLEGEIMQSKFQIQITSGKQEQENSKNQSKVSFKGSIRLVDNQAQSQGLVKKELFRYISALVQELVFVFGK